MRIEVTYIDTSAPAKRRKLTLPKPGLPKLYKTGEHKFELRVPKAFIKVLASAAVLLVVLVGGGVAYTYFLGGGAAQTVGTETVAAKSYQAITPQTPAPNTPEGVAVSSLSSPVSPGADAFMAVQTLPDSTCSISLKYGNGDIKTPSTAAGLHDVTADAFGSASWSWTVDASAPVGTWPVTVTCEHNKHTGVVQGDMQVASPSSSTATN